MLTTVLVTFNQQTKFEVPSFTLSKIQGPKITSNIDHIILTTPIWGGVLVSAWYVISRLTIV